MGTALRVLDKQHRRASKATAVSRGGGITHAGKSEGVMRLKRCPFCGGKAEKLAAEEPSSVGGYVLCGYVVQCKDCESSTRVWFPAKDSVDEILAQAWNRRAGRE